ncbi:MarR family winged helix-turn-helix transcriptional regulator [Mesoaciditoga lauensis]|uniref:MarR family winged helix-turn-helix transcriptional regulator n=1 Tax=Mesoaciditoga lauensis TaxID=1495039 RepID=UPI00056C9163|nr:MarR family transcriptional regulator [Mesoaciditoga lauensis]
MEKNESKKILEMVFDLIINFTKILPSCEETENLKTMEFYILMYIGMKSSKKMSELARVFSIAKSNVTVLVDGMEKKGYLKRVRNSDDRRVINVELTDKGKRLFDLTVKNFEKVINDVMERIPPKDLDVISDGFFRMIKIFNSSKSAKSAP